MGMPWQLKVGLHNKRERERKYGPQEPKPLAELTPQIDVNDLDVPRDHKTYIANISLRFPHLTGMKINRNMVQFHHSNRVQTFDIRWHKVGFGQRPKVICECGRPARKLYLRNQHLACRECHNLTYASRAISTNNRPRLQASRLHNYLILKTNTRKHTKQQLQDRLNRITMPIHNYGTRGTAHWK